jgi:hypothetical protein
MGSSLQEHRVRLCISRRCILAVPRYTQGLRSIYLSASALGCRFGTNENFLSASSLCQVSLHQHSVPTSNLTRQPFPLHPHTAKYSPHPDRRRDGNPGARSVAPRPAGRNASASNAETVQYGKLGCNQALPLRISAGGGRIKPCHATSSLFDTDDTGHQKRID